MRLYNKTKFHSLKLKGNDYFEAKTLEQELEQALHEKRPIEKNAIGSIFYTRKQHGVLPECDIRTDRFDLAQHAMEKLAENAKKARATKLQQGEIIDEPDTKKSAEH